MELGNGLGRKDGRGWWHRSATIEDRRNPHYPHEAASRHVLRLWTDHVICTFSIIKNQNHERVAGIEPA